MTHLRAAFRPLVVAVIVAAALLLEVLTASSADAHSRRYFVNNASVGIWTEGWYANQWIGKTINPGVGTTDGYEVYKWYVGSCRAAYYKVNGVARNVRGPSWVYVNGDHDNVAVTSTPRIC